MLAVRSGEFRRLRMCPVSFGRTARRLDRRGDEPARANRGRWVPKKTYKKTSTQTWEQLRNNNPQKPAKTRDQGRPESKARQQLSDRRPCLQNLHPRFKSGRRLQSFLGKTHIRCRADDPDRPTVTVIVTAATKNRNFHRAGYATRSRSRSEYGSISTTIFLTAALGALRRPTVFIVMKPAASNLASVRVRFGWACPVMVTNSATDRGFRSRIRASSRRLSGVSSRTTASTELKLGLLASAGAGRW